MSGITHAQDDPNTASVEHTTIADTDEWQALQEHVAEVDAM